MVDPLSGIALGDNVQAGNYKGRRWVYNTPAGTDEKGKNSDPSTKVVIMMSRRIVNKTLDSVDVGIRENFWNSLQHILYSNLHSTQRKDTKTEGKGHNHATTTTVTVTNDTKIGLHNAGGRLQLSDSKKHT